MPGYDFPGPRSTPTVDGSLIVALDAWGELVCLNAADGKEKWRKSLVKDLGGAPPTWGYSESPLVDGGLVVVTPGGPKGALAAFDKQTGQLVWQSKEFTDAAHYSSIVPAEIDGTRQYVQLTAASVVGISAKDGSLLWKAPRHGSVAVIPTPLVAGNEVYVTSGYNAGCNLFKVAKTGAKFSAEQVYANHVMGNHHGGTVRVGDYIYGYSENKGLSCQNARTGEALWAEKARSRNVPSLMRTANFIAAKKTPAQWSWWTPRRAATPKKAVSTNPSARRKRPGASCHCQREALPPRSGFAALLRHQGRSVRASFRPMLARALSVALSAILLAFQAAGAGALVSTADAGTIGPGFAAQTATAMRRRTIFPQIGAKPGTYAGKRLSTALAGPRRSSGQTSLAHNGPA